MTNPTSNFGWQMPTSTDLVTDLPADFEVFGQAVDTSMADLKGGTTGQILSKATNADMDFTWITNDIGDITAVNVTAPITGGGTSGAVTIGVDAASTSAAGVVQLSDSTSTTSSVLASTPTATKSAYDLANTANTAAGAAQTTANSATTTANAAIPKSTVTTAGDVIYATGSSAVTRLGIGTAGQVLTVNGGGTAPSWTTISTAQTFVGATVYINNSNVSYTNGVATLITPTASEYDTNSFWSAGTNPSRFTIPSGKSGKYLININHRTDDGIPSYIQFELYKNGSRVTGTGLANGLFVSFKNLGSNNMTAVGSVVVSAAAGDYFQVYQQADLSTGNHITYYRWSISYLGA